MFSLGIEPSTTRTKGSSLPFLGVIEKLHEVVANFIGEHGIVQMNFGQAGDRAQQNIFNAGLRGRGDRDRIAVTAKAGGNPENVNVFNGWRFLRERDHTELSLLP